MSMRCKRLVNNWSLLWTRTVLRQALALQFFRVKFLRVGRKDIAIALSGSLSPLHNLGPGSR
jgi:hypothetical protein